MPFKKVVVTVLFMGIGIISIPRAEEKQPEEPSAFDELLDSIGVTGQDLQGKVNSTKLFGGSSPVSFSGEGRVKIGIHNIKSDVEWMQEDRTYVQSGWEGNESLIRMGMVVRAGRNTVLWSKIGFQSTLPGNRWVPPSSEVGGIAQGDHDKSLVSANIHEDMNAGIAVRTVPASFWLKMGNVNWIEASPFTIWKAQPRTFAWEFLPYEVEQPIARYYEYNIAMGEKAGRAAWHKKAFNGINFESINLPHRLYFNLVWAACERYDNYEQEYTDFSNDLAYAGAKFPVKGTGIGDSYRHAFHVRLAANKLIGELTPGLNFFRLDYSDDVITSKDDNQYLFLTATGNGNVNKGWNLGLPDTLEGTAFYKEPKVFSLDVRGPMFNRLLDIHADIAFGNVDTTYLVWKRDSVTGISGNYTKEKKTSDLGMAFYSKLAFDTKIPFQLDIAAIGKGFYSPLSFAAPQDAFFAFNSNMVGSGKFIGRGEASPYVQNMAGALLTVIPKLPGYGHLRVAYGQHAQLEPGRDILYLPFRLNGLDFFSFWHSSYMRWGNGPIHSPDYIQHGRRLGNESFLTSGYNSPPGLESGGLFTDFLSSSYCFVPWEDTSAMNKNMLSRAQDVSYTRIVDGDTSTTAFVPVNRKFTNNFEIDVAYDISGMINFPNDFFLGGYFALNNVAKALTPLALSEKGDNTQLWSMYFRFEPAIALTKKFYLLGIFGYENWRAQNSYIDIPTDKYEPESDEAFESMLDKLEGFLSAHTPDLEAVDGSGVTHRYFKSPIDFRDGAIGLGFDWEILSRVGLHGRFKYMWHKDANFSYNDWATPVVSMEIKSWF